MSLPDKHTNTILGEKALHFTVLLLSSFCLLLTGCGFEPMYNSGTRNAYGDVSTRDQFARISINNIPDKEGQALRNLLIDRFYRTGRPSRTDYVLNLSTLKEIQRNLDLTIESETTRAQLEITTTLTLIDKATDKVILNKTLRAYNSYNVLGSQFTTIVSEDDARDAILNDLARQVETQLTLYFSN